MRKHRLVWALCVLNVILVVVLAMRAIGETRAQAQAARRVSDYIMVPAAVLGGTNGVVYVIDSGNGLMSAMIYDDNRKDISVMPAMDLARLFDSGTGVGGTKSVPAPKK